jgi:tetratricopeptide (TPR) repeat protein
VQKINPLTWLGLKKKAGPAEPRPPTIEERPTPIPPRPSGRPMLAVTSPGLPTNAPPKLTTPTPESAASPVASPPAAPPRPKPPIFARYPYRSLVKPAAGNRAAAVQSFAEGLKAHKDQKVREAITAYKKATEADPAFFEAHYNLGVAAYEHADWSQALGAYEHALAIAPNDANARFNFALTLQRANYPLDAARELETLAAAHPDEVNTHFTLANIYAQPLAQPQQARAHYLKVLQLDPRHPQAAAIRFWLAAHPD